MNNCATVEVIEKGENGCFLNLSRLDADLVQRYSLGKVVSGFTVEDAATLRVTYNFERVPKKRE